MISLTHRKEVIDSAVERYERQYGDGRYPVHSAKIAPLKGLKRDEGYADEIDRIIGNDSWTKLTCGECDQRVDVIANIGTDHEWGGPAVGVCEECLSNALNMLIKSTP